MLHITLRQGVTESACVQHNTKQDYIKSTSANIEHSQCINHYQEMALKLKAALQKKADMSFHKVQLYL